MKRIELLDLVATHAAFPSLLQSLVTGTETWLLRARETDARWSPLEILVHIADEEIEDFRPRAQAAALEKPLPWAIDPPAWVVERKYNEQEPGAVLERFAQERADSCAWLRTLSAAQLDRALEHPTFGRMRCGDFIASWRMHDLLHLRQLTTALAVLNARALEGWRTEYAGRIPEAT